MRCGCSALSHITHFRRVRARMYTDANAPKKHPKKTQTCLCFPVIFPHLPSEWGLVRTPGLHGKHQGHQGHQEE